VAKTKAFPETIYVKTESDSGNVYFVADDDPHSLVEMGEKIKIGIYQLVETQTAEGVAKLSIG